MKRSEYLVKRRRSLRWVVSACMIAMMSWAPYAMAQATTVIPEQQKSAPIKQWIAVVVFGGLMIFIAAKNPKRTHQS